MARNISEFIKPTTSICCRRQDRISGMLRGTLMRWQTTWGEASGILPIERKQFVYFIFFVIGMFVFCKFLHLCVWILYLVFFLFCVFCIYVFGFCIYVFVIGAFCILCLLKYILCLLGSFFVIELREFCVAVALKHYI